MSIFFLPVNPADRFACFNTPVAFLVMLSRHKYIEYNFFRQEYVKKRPRYSGVCSSTKRRKEGKL